MTTALPFHAAAAMSGGINSYGYYNEYGSSNSDYWTSGSPYPNSVSSHGESPDPYASPAPHAAAHGPSSAPSGSYFGGSTLSSATSYAVDSHPYASSGPGSVGPTPPHGGGGGGYPTGEAGIDADPIGSSADPPRIGGPKRRVTAGRKERRRTASINNAFSDLRDCIPNVPPDTKLSKIKTLRLATSYIAYLMELLDSENANLDALTTLPGHGFKAELGKRTRTPEQEERRKRELALAMLDAPGRGKKGRTGWPQHVWALELETNSPQHHHPAGNSGNCSSSNNNNSSNSSSSGNNNNSNSNSSSNNNNSNHHHHHHHHHHPHHPQQQNHTSTPAVLTALMPPPASGGQQHQQQRTPASTVDL